MRSPKVGKQRSASGAFSLSRSLPKLGLPPSSASKLVARPRPVVGKPKPGGSVKGGRNG
ncbi:MAG TPA: hypothetical protein VGD79_03180 [Thermoanaerobaculia bacterium]